VTVGAQEHLHISPRAGISLLKSSSLLWRDAVQLSTTSSLQLAGIAGGCFVLFLGNANMVGNFFWVWEEKGQLEQISQPKLKTERGKTVC